MLEFYSEKPGVPDARTLEVMQHAGVQLGRVVERERHAEAVRSLSLTDELTGLNNRRGFLALADAQLRLAGRRKKACLLVRSRTCCRRPTARCTSRSGAGS